MARGKRRRNQVEPAPDTALQPATDPETNLLMADLVMRIGTTFLRRFVEKRILKGRYGKETAQQVMRNKSASSTLTAVAVSRVATSSVPGAALVGTGLIARTLYERGKARRARGKRSAALESDSSDT